MKKRLLCSFLSALLFLSMTVPARAADLPFRDVTPSNWFYTAVSELYNIQLVNGVSADCFDPHGTVNLGQALKMILLAAGYGPQPPVDDHWASGYFALARDGGLLPAGRFNTLNSPISRLQIAELATKALKLERTGTGTPFSDTTEAFALIAYDHGIFTGSPSGDTLVFNAADTITRAEMSAVTWRIVQNRANAPAASPAPAPAEPAADPASAPAEPTNNTASAPAEAADKTADAPTEPVTVPQSVSGVPAEKSSTYIQLAGTKVYLAEDIPRNPYDPDLFQFNENGYLTYDSDEYTCAVGIDVSKYQGAIDWQRVRASGIQFAILRLGLRGYGTGKLVMDETFYTNLREARAAGIQVGAYFFSQAITPQEAVEEANYCAAALKGYKITYPLIYDWEPYDSTVDARTHGLEDEVLTQCCKAFLDRVKELGYTPMLYANPTYFYRHLDMTELTGYPLWLANYVEMTSFYYQYDMWQYSYTGTVPGIEGNVDLNIQMIKK